MVAQERLRYGDRPSQFVEIWRAAGNGPPRGVVISLHGGWWRDRHDLHLMDPLCAQLHHSGWTVANVEYRRTSDNPDGNDGGDAGGWPVTMSDVASAIAAVGAAELCPGESPTIAIGHSAGGHLALMSLSRGLIDSAVALAPITDLARCSREGLGEGATLPFMGFDPDTDPQAYRESSPISQAPNGRQRLIVHGHQDDRVPVEHSRDYMSVAMADSEPASYVEAVDTDHFDVIDPGHRSWQLTQAWLDTQYPRG